MDDFQIEDEEEQELEGEGCEHEQPIEGGHPEYVWFLGGVRVSGVILAHWY